MEDNNFLSPPEFADGPVAAAVNGAVNAITPNSTSDARAGGRNTAYFSVRIFSKAADPEPLRNLVGGATVLRGGAGHPLRQEAPRTSAEAVIEINTFV
jgi:hypothetical protein